MKKISRRNFLKVSGVMAKLVYRLLQAEAQNGTKHGSPAA